MTAEDFQFYAALTAYVLDTSEVHAISTKTFLLWLDSIEPRMRALRALIALPADSDALRAVMFEFDAAQRLIAGELAEKKQLILDQLARIESHHERLGHALDRLKASLPPPGQESP